jgi:polysaccharide chain length determinant protein (PEP-CTERM system associated)
MITQVLSPHDYLAVIRRKKWMIVWIILGSLLVGATLCALLPKMYRSSTLIVVENQRVPENYVKGVLTNAPQDRLATIQQLVLSRSILGRVIEEFKLYEAGQDLSVVLEQMRKRVAITTTREHAFMLSFSHESPLTAQRVTARLAELFIEQNLKTREQMIGEASEFLESELNAAQKELDIKEKAISEFKLTHMGELPSQMEANLRALDRLQAEMTATQESISRLNDRLGQVDKAIKEYEAGEGTGFLNPVAGVQPPLARAVDLRAARIKELERNLADLSASYKDTYPDIIHLKQEIAKLKALPIEEDGDKHVREEPTANGKAIEKPIEKKSLDPYHREMLRQRAEIKAELQSLKDRHERIGREIRQYEGRVERTPMREQQLASLMRDYDNMQRNYQALLDRRLNARMAANLEKRQKGEQFRIIDPAHLPSFPESPDVLKIMMVSLVAGCGLGFGAAIMLETMRNGFRHGEEVERLLGIPVLAEIPSFQTAFGTSLGALRFDQKSAKAESHTRALLPRWGKTSEGSPTAKKDVFLLNRTAGAPDLHLVMKWRPMSAVAEQYRVAATRLALMSSGRKSTVIVVTSSLKGEGKTSTALNVGYAIAHDLGKSTLVIDCDMKQPRIHTYAGLSADPGLVQILQQEGMSFESCLHQLDESPLWILPAGSVPARPVELFKLKRLTSMLEVLKERYEYIILDAPPILPLADMNVFAGMADILAMVVRSTDTPTDVVQKALKSLKSTSQAGIILTGIQANEAPFYMLSGYYATTTNPKR